MFLDFLAGAGVLSLGHNHPEVVRAIQGQLGELVHGLDFPTPAKDEFTELLLAMLPGDLGSRFKLHFCGPTGANGVEAAIKLCKIATGRGDIVAFSGGFHGSTAGAMATSGNLGPKEPVRNGMPGVHFFPFSNCLRCPLGLRPDVCAPTARPTSSRCWNDPSGGIPKPAAVLLEPIQGEGGTIPARLEFVRRLRDITRRLDIPLIVDEVQTGCGAAGTWFAFEQYGIEPDVIVASKALSGAGLPGLRTDLPSRARCLAPRSAYRHVPWQSARVRRRHRRAPRDDPRRRARQRPRPWRAARRTAGRAGRAQRRCGRRARARVDVGASTSPIPRT